MIDRRGHRALVVASGDHAPTPSSPGLSRWPRLSGHSGIPS